MGRGMARLWGATHNVIVASEDEMFHCPWPCRRLSVVATHFPEQQFLVFFGPLSNLPKPSISF
jgi:hypothetical protein